MALFTGNNWLKEKRVKSLNLVHSIGSTHQYYVAYKSEEETKLNHGGFLPNVILGRYSVQTNFSLTGAIRDRFLKGSIKIFF